MGAMVEEWWYAERVPGTPAARAHEIFAVDLEEISPTSLPEGAWLKRGPEPAASRTKFCRNREIG